jgi:predicted enzyme related to lactoylglutathione lyase
MGAQVIHVEVTGKDGAKLQQFFKDVFGWSLDTNNPGGYGMYRQEDGLTGGIGAAQEGTQGGVTFYVHTDDPKGTLARAEAAGGRVLMPLTEVAPETTIALFADPEGHVIGSCSPESVVEGRVPRRGPAFVRPGRCLRELRAVSREL